MCRNIKEKEKCVLGADWPVIYVRSLRSLSTQTLARLDGGVWGKVRQSQAVSVGVRVFSRQRTVWWHCGGHADSPVLSALRVSRAPVCRAAIMDPTICRI